jgi:hypothetical protein
MSENNCFKMMAFLIIALALVSQLMLPDLKDIFPKLFSEE